MADILIVEDDKDLNNAYKIILENEGHNVVSVFNGQEALKELENFEPQLILLDLLMPVMDGRQFLRKYDNQRNIPVVVLSNLDGKKDIEQLLKLGASNYLVKSAIDPTTLVTIVKATLATKKG